MSYSTQLTQQLLVLASYSHPQAIITPPESSGQDVHFNVSHQPTANEPIPNNFIPGSLPPITARVTTTRLRGLRVDIPDLSGWVAKLERVCVNRYSKVYRGIYQGHMVCWPFLLDIDFSFRT